MDILYAFLTIGFTFIIMECWAWFMHKYLLHGPLWFLHSSHHRPRKSWWEWNDLVSVLYAGIALILMLVNPPFSIYFNIGLGITLYGLCYFWLHDIIIHRRIKVGYRFRSAYINRLIRAHKIHHKQLKKAPSEAFGFLFAISKYQVKKKD